jgi:hypothetical protein
MGTYSREDFQQIASAIDKDVCAICQYKNDFEAAALMYRLDLAVPQRQKPAELRKRLIQIGNTARKLLRLLKIPRKRRMVRRAMYSRRWPRRVTKLRTRLLEQGHEWDGW